MGEEVILIVTTTQYYLIICFFVCFHEKENGIGWYLLKCNLWKEEEDGQRIWLF